MNGSMTERQFLDYAAEVLPYWEESLAETEAQAKSETAMFGDAWPGAWIQIREMRQEIAAVRRQRERLLSRANKPTR